MGLGSVSFILNEDNSLTRIPSTKWERLISGDYNLPQYANQKRVSITIILRLTNRKPDNGVFDLCAFNFDEQGFIKGYLERPKLGISTAINIAKEISKIYEVPMEFVQTVRNNQFLLVRVPFYWS